LPDNGFPIPPRALEGVASAADPEVIPLAANTEHQLPASLRARLARRLNHFRFESVWDLDRPCDEVFHVLQDLFSYSSWWPEVKKVQVVDDTTAYVMVRALLPYTLRFQLEQQLAAPEAGVLQASMTGDLQGWSRWTLSPSAGGCRLRFEEEVWVNRFLLKVLSPVARPLLAANHYVMMRRGERGLRQFLRGNSRPSSEV
jgi:hypothetical protein